MAIMGSSMHKTPINCKPPPGYSSVGAEAIRDGNSLLRPGFNRAFSEQLWLVEIEEAQRRIRMVRLGKVRCSVAFRSQEWAYGRRLTELELTSPPWHLIEVSDLRREFQVSISLFTLFLLWFIFLLTVASWSSPVSASSAGEALAEAGPPAEAGPFAPQWQLPPPAAVDAYATK